MKSMKHKKNIRRICSVMTATLMLTAGTAGMMPVPAGLSFLTVSAVEDKDTDLNPDPDYVEQVLALVNQERETAGLQPLQAVPVLNDVAQIRAEELAEQFDHTRPDGSTFTSMLRGLFYQKATEIMAKQNSPEACVNAFMNSANHRERLLDAEVTSVGIGVNPDESDKNGGAYYALILVSGLGEEPGDPENPGDSENPGEDEIPAYAQEMLDRINQERRTAGIAPLAYKADLGDAAQIRSAELTERFGHVRPNKTNFVKILNEQDIPYTVAMELIDANTGSAQDAVDTWMASTIHRNQVLDDSVEYVGIGLTTAEVDGEEQSFWAVLLIRESEEVSGSDSPGDSDNEELTKEQRLAEEICALVNVEREKEGLQPLQCAPFLDAAAQTRAGELQERYSHDRPDGSDFITVAGGLEWKTACENLQFQGADQTAEAVVNTWMDSEIHRNNILNPDVQYVGTGVVSGVVTDNIEGVENGTEGCYYAQIFIGGVQLEDAYTPGKSENSGNSLRGDANGDGAVDISDVVMMNRVCVGVDHLSAQGIANADTDDDGKITLADSMNVLRFLVHLIDEL